MTDPLATDVMESLGAMGDPEAADGAPDPLRHSECVTVTLELAAGGVTVVMEVLGAGAAEEGVPTE